MRESHLHGDCGLLQHGPPAQSRARGALSHSCHILKAACSSMSVPYWCHAQVLKVTGDLCYRFQQSMSVALQRKFYCKDFLSPGRARVRLFDDNGKPANPAIPNSALCFLSTLSFLNGCMPNAPAELHEHDTLDYSRECTTKPMVHQGSRGGAVACLMCRESAVREGGRAVPPASRQVREGEAGRTGKAARGCIQLCSLVQQAERQEWQEKAEVM